MATGGHAWLPLLAQKVAGPCQLVKLARESIAAKYVIESNPGPSKGSRARRNRRGGRRGRRKGRGPANPQKDTAGLVGGRMHQMTGGDPAARKVTLKYWQAYDYVNVGGSANVWRGNGVFDPDASGTGAQPYNYDDFSVRYSQYYVTACRIKVTIQPESTNVGEGLVVALCPTNVATGITIPDMISAPGGKWGVTSYGGQAKPLVLTAVARTSDVLGYKNREGYETLSAVTSVPANQWYWRVVVGTVTAVMTLDYSVTTELEYDVTFVNRNSLTLDVLERKVQLAEKRLAEAKSGQIRLFQPRQRITGGEDAKTSEDVVIVSHPQLAGVKRDEVKHTPRSVLPGAGKLK